MVHAVCAGTARPIATMNDRTSENESMASSGKCNGNSLSWNGRLDYLDVLILKPCSRLCTFFEEYSFLINRGVFGEVDSISLE